ncbi:MAG: hypothetical protein EOM12_17805 [Verrucomicrobiae bacterium]|nr:hypothetical protein [Verrucomicrobiae bacterium]
MICPACKEGAIVATTLEEHLSALQCKKCGGCWVSAKNYALAG